MPGPVVPCVIFLKREWLACERKMNKVVAGGSGNGPGYTWEVRMVRRKDGGEGAYGVWREVEQLPADARYTPKSESEALARLGRSVRLSA